MVAVARHIDDDDMSIRECLPDNRSISDPTIAISVTPDAARARPEKAARVFR